MFSPDNKNLGIIFLVAGALSFYFFSGGPDTSIFFKLLTVGLVGLGTGTIAHAKGYNFWLFLALGIAIHVLAVIIVFTLHNWNENYSEIFSSKSSIIFILMLAITVAIALIVLNIFLESQNMSDREVDPFDGGLYYIVVFIVGLIAGIYAGSLVDIWVGTYVGHIVWFIYISQTASDLGNLWPLSVLFMAVTSLIALFGASIGRTVYLKFSHNDAIQ
jgi:hypothetical protein